MSARTRSRLALGLPEGVRGARRQSVEDDLDGRGQQDLEVEAEGGLLVGAAGEEHQLILGVGVEERPDGVGSPSPRGRPPVGC